MRGGFLSGMVAGIAAGVAGLVALSLAAPPEPALAPIDGAQIPVAAPAAPQSPAVAPRPELPQARTVPRADTAPGQLASQSHALLPRQSDVPDAGSGPRGHVAAIAAPRRLDLAGDAGAAQLAPGMQPPVIALPGRPGWTPTPFDAAPEGLIEPTAQPAAGRVVLAQPQPARADAGTLPDLAILYSVPQPDTWPLVGTLGAPSPERVQQPRQPSAPPPARERHAASFGRGTAPPVAVVLIDDGLDPTARARMARLEVAVSFALPSDHPELAAATARYRAGGHEVLALAEHPDAAAAALAAVPGAVGVAVTGPGADLATLEVALWRSGHGLAAVAPAEGAGAQTTRLRPLGDTGDPIRRGLNRAARHAVDGGAAGVIGRADPETLNALESWLGERRASWVALAPVSALWR